MGSRVRAGHSAPAAPPLGLSLRAWLAWFVAAGLCGGAGPGAVLPGLGGGASLPRCELHLSPYSLITAWPLC